jgi:hypothetical protein
MRNDLLHVMRVKQALDGLDEAEPLLAELVVHEGLVEFQQLWDAVLAGQVQLNGFLDMSLGREDS